jgi:peptide chain release factor 1
MSQVDIQVSRGSGPGGQHRNKTESCVTATHRPTGISVRIDLKSQHQSRAVALDVLAARVAQGRVENASQGRNEARKRMLGSGQRGDKRRTYRERDNQVTDHVTGQTWRLKQWMRGEW